MVLLTSGALSDPLPVYTVVEHCLLATDGDRITVGLSLSLHPGAKLTVICTNKSLKLRQKWYISSKASHVHLCMG